MPTRLLHIDAFTTRPFAGNPAAVCLLDSEHDEHWMQEIAAEMNLAETAFVAPLGSGKQEFALRWFTPMAEVPLCGHATLASAHALWQTGRVPQSQTVRFQTLSGELRASIAAEGITLDFPAIPTAPGPMPPAFEVILSAPVMHFEITDAKYLAELANEEAVRDLTPDLPRLAHLPKQGVVATARGTDCDFVSRFFAPRIGVPEDPVTGSAHCLLATYWAPRLGKTTFRAKQLSKRGGELLVELDGDRVRLTGHAVTLFDTQLAD